MQAVELDNELKLILLLISNLEFCSRTGSPNDAICVRLREDIVNRMISIQKKLAA